MTSDSTSDTSSVSAESWPLGSHSGTTPHCEGGTEERTELSTTIVLEVAEQLGEDPVDLTPPLNEILDPDALDSLFVGDRSDAVVSFSAWGCTVTAFGDGHVRVDRND